MLLFKLFDLELRLTRDEVDADFFRLAFSWTVLNFWWFCDDMLLWLLKLCVEFVA